MALSPVPKFASVAGDLPLQAPDHLVEGRGHVLPGRFGPEDAARGRARHLHAVPSVDPRVRFFRDLHFDPGDSGIDPGELADLMLGRSPDLVGDLDPAALEDEIHAHLTMPNRTSGSQGKAPAWLTWSLAPHSPAEGIAAISAS